MIVYDAELRGLVPIVIGVRERRGADFTSAEDAVQDALVESFRTWSGNPPRDPKGWLITVAWRKFLDRNRAESARTAREERALSLAKEAPTTSTDDTVDLYFLCAHPDLSPASAVALTLRAVAGLTTRQIAEAYLVPEATMAQRISRAKRSLAGRRLNRPGNVSAVLKVLYLVFNEGYSGHVDLSAEAIRLTRVLAASIDHAEGVVILQAALARDELGEYQAQAAIAALHADAPRVEETDWRQILRWYDELVGLNDSPIVRLNRAVALGEVDGPGAGLEELSRLDESLPRYFAVAAHLRERAGEIDVAAQLYVQAGDKATSLAEREHLIRQAARLNMG